MSAELPAATAYGRVDRWLHALALQTAALRELSFDLERALYLPPAPDAADRPIYVCGLARSGTTLLLRSLAGAPGLRSLTYRDMPFVLAPNLWRAATRHGQRRMQAVERAHADGVMVDFDSPEAFEEVFWRTFGGAAAGADGSYGHDGDAPAGWDEFRQYRALIANPKGAAARQRYLSKNNNNVLRLSGLLADDTAAVVLAYRDPVDTARSLHRVHRLFCEQAADRFMLRYMGWLGHHEFGPGHRPFRLARAAMTPGLDPSQPDYWLDYWTAVHRALLGQIGSARLRLVEHDALRRAPQATLGALFGWLGLEDDGRAAAGAIRTEDSRQRPPDEFAPRLLESAREVHAQWQRHPSNLAVVP